VGVSEENKRRTILENELVKLRNIVSGCFEESLLLQTKSSTYSEGIFNHVVMSLMGSNTAFREKEVRTIIPLDVNRLYFMAEDSLEPLEVVPFIRLLCSPRTEENACYFYNRMDKR
jgi:hypothetical protein